MAMGRPKKPAGSTRESAFTIRLTSEERVLLSAAAARAGEDLSSWARKTLTRSARRSTVVTDVRPANGDEKIEEDEGFEPGREI
jgi:uncharacterized protein (DUF1778 family)